MSDQSFFHAANVIVRDICFGMKSYLPIEDVELMRKLVTAGLRNQHTVSINKLRDAIADSLSTPVEPEVPTPATRCCL